MDNKKLYDKAVKELPAMAAGIYDKYSYPTIQSLVKLCQANIDIAYANFDEEEEKEDIKALNKFIKKYSNKLA